MGQLLINTEFLPQRFHRQQMLTANGVVIHARIKLRQFDSNVDGSNRIGTDKVNFGMVDLLGKMERLFHQLFVQGVVVVLFAGEIHRHYRFTAFRPRLVFYHPDRTRTFTQQVPVGRGEDHRFQLVVLVGHLQQQVVLATHHFLDDGFERTVMPHHFDLNGDTGFKIEFCLFADPGGTLADHSLTHSGAFVRRQKGGHFVREVIYRQKRFNSATNPLM